MNPISKYLCSYYSNNDDCYVSGVSDLRVVGTALAGIALVGIAYASLFRNKNPQMVKVFEERWKVVNPDKRCIGMNGFITERDTAILKQLFRDWRLNSGLCLFDVLGVDIYRNWKRLGGPSPALDQFCLLSKNLSIALTASLENSPQSLGPTFKRLHSNFSALARSLPPELKQKFQFMLKVISNPQKAAILGTSSMQLFDGGEKLDQGQANREDILDYLEFTVKMDPYFKSLEPPSASNKRSDFNAAKLSKALNHLISKTQKDFESARGMIHFEIGFRLEFLNRLKEMVDDRLLNMSVPTFRMFENALHTLLLEQSKYKEWFYHQYSDFVAKDFLPLIAKVFGELGEVDTIAGDAISNFFRIHAAKLQIRGSLEGLEQQIVSKLKTAVDLKEVKTEDEYAYLFADMIRLYQIAHDFRYIREPNKDLLRGSDFPASFVDLICFPAQSQEPAVEEERSLPALAPPPCSAPLTIVETPVSKPIVRNNEEMAGRKKRAKQVDKKESDDSKESPIVPDLRRSSEVLPERPSFPEKNARAQEVIATLLRNGFSIQRTTGGHYQMLHRTTGVTTTVPYHSRKEIKSGTLAAIRRSFYQSQGFE